MGPRPGGHGKLPFTIRGRLRGPVSMGPRPGGHGKRFADNTHGFARRMFQWGHDPEVMVSTKMAIGKFVLAVFQWGHDPEVMVSRPDRPVRRRFCDVSMGPRPGGHGKIREQREEHARKTAFQWGHDPEVMVRQATPTTDTWYNLVSMGPRPGGHGKFCAPDGSALPFYAFQWGHDPEVMVRHG